MTKLRICLGGSDLESNSEGVLIFLIMSSALTLQSDIKCIGFNGEIRKWPIHLKFFRCSMSVFHDLYNDRKQPYDAQKRCLNYLFLSKFAILMLQIPIACLIWKDVICWMTLNLAELHIKMTVLLEYLWIHALLLVVCQVCVNTNKICNHKLNLIILTQVGFFVMLTWSLPPLFSNHQKTLLPVQF